MIFKMNNNTCFVLTIFIILTIFGSSSSSSPKPSGFHPQQVHLSYGDNPSQMVVTWVTFNKTNSTLVEYGLIKLDMIQKGTSSLFIDGGREKRHMYIHRVILDNLKPGQRYVYHCGGLKGWSPLFFFNAMQSGQDWKGRFAVFGDMGSYNGVSIPTLEEMAQKEQFDAVFHVGDMAYNMDSDNARIGDEFMRRIESIAAYVPYMVAPGNHEQAYNFSNYKQRFSMPKNGDGENMYYSFDVGPMHVISFSSEVYYYYVSETNIMRMYNWLKNDLENANLPENRRLRPWIIAMAHKPMYCTNSDDPPICFNKHNPVRVGSMFERGKGIEDLFCKYGVDIYYSGHEHSYERLLPIYNFAIRNGSDAHPFTNPKATVHIITGSAGNVEAQDPFTTINRPFSVYHTCDFGFTMMYVHNKTHLHLQQLSTTKGSQVIDDFWLIKDSAGAPNFNCTKS